MALNKAVPKNDPGDMLKYGKIGVLMGGDSSEREISLKSGKAVYESLKLAGLDVVPIDIKTHDRQPNIRLLKDSGIQCAFIAMHGIFGEDGQLQSILEDVNIPYTGSGVKASHLAMDKAASHEIFENAGLNVPKYKVLNKKTYQPGIGGLDFPFPVVVKPSANGSSVGLSIVDHPNGLADAIGLAFSFDDTIIIEEFIKGRELTVGILEDAALPVIEIVPKKRFFDYEAKYQSGMTDYKVPACLDKALVEKVQEAGLAAHRSLGCEGYSRVDIILNENNLPFVLEVNSIPGMTATSLLPKAAGVSGIGFGQLCIKLIVLALNKKPSSRS